MNIRTKILLCIFGNLISLLLVLGAIVLFDNHGTYWKFGSHDKLIVISIHIDTWSRYSGLFALIAVVNIMKVLSEEIGMPILGFNIYNPDKKIITEFGKNELQVYGNTMFMINAIRGVFITVISITQIDIALWSVIIRECASFITIRMLLNEKEFRDFECDGPGPAGVPKTDIDMV